MDQRILGLLWGAAVGDSIGQCTQGRKKMVATVIYPPPVRRAHLDMITAQMAMIAKAGGYTRAFPANLKRLVAYGWECKDDSCGNAPPILRSITASPGFACAIQLQAAQNRDIAALRAARDTFYNGCEYAEKDATVIGRIFGIVATADSITSAVNQTCDAIMQTYDINEHLDCLSICVILYHITRGRADFDINRACKEAYEAVVDYIKAAYQNRHIVRALLYEFSSNLIEFNDDGHMDLNVLNDAVTLHGVLISHSSLRAARFALQCINTSRIAGGTPNYKKIVTLVAMQCGDADQNCAIVGAILGAYLGARAIPQDCISAVAHSNELDSLFGECAVKFVTSTVRQAGGAILELIDFAPESAHQPQPPPAVRPPPTVQQ